MIQQQVKVETDTEEEVEEKEASGSSIVEEEKSRKETVAVAVEVIIERRIIRHVYKQDRSNDHRKIMDLHPPLLQLQLQLLVQLVQLVPVEEVRGLAAAQQQQHHKVHHHDHRHHPLQLQLLVASETLGQPKKKLFSRSAKIQQAVLRIER